MQVETSREHVAVMVEGIEHLQGSRAQSAAAAALREGLTMPRENEAADKHPALPEPEATRLALALLSLAKSNIPTDVQALLVYGDERGDVAPGALHRAIEAALGGAA